MPGLDGGSGAYLIDYHSFFSRALIPAIVLGPLVYVRISAAEQIGITQRHKAWVLFARLGRVSLG